MIELMIEQRRKDLGGFEVGRVLPYVKRRMVGPFIFFDHMGPAVFEAGIARDKDVRPHPHIGLSTLTYLFDGEITHRDSVGSEQVIAPGEANWMTAGSGITHSERFEGLRQRGGTIHGIQSWVALPDADEECPPDFFHADAGDLPAFDETGVRARLVAGTAHRKNAPIPVHSPLFYIHLELAPGARFQLPNDYPERAAYVVSGRIEAAGERIDAGHMAIVATGADVVLAADQPTVVMLLGGEPIGPRFIDWNFVSSSKDRLMQARADWQAGRMTLPVGDDKEFIPYPA